MKKTHSKQSHHTTIIKKGKTGKLSKIREELDELEDAENQGIKVLQICELCDLVKAIKAYMKFNFGLEFSDLHTLSKLTKALKNGK